MRGDGCRKVCASVESGPSELAIGDIGGSSVERLIDYFVVTAEFFLHHSRPAAVHRVPFTGTTLIRDEAPRKGIAVDHDSDRLCKTGTDERQYSRSERGTFSFGSGGLREHSII